VDSPPSTSVSSFLLDIPLNWHSCKPGTARILGDILLGSNASRIHPCGWLPLIALRRICQQEYVAIVDVFRLICTGVRSCYPA
jgi:hypothetical protein